MVTGQEFAVEILLMEPHTYPGPSMTSNDCVEGLFEIADLAGWTVEEDEEIEDLLDDNE
jgi:hypothetical protein